MASLGDVAPGVRDRVAKLAGTHVEDALRLYGPPAVRVVKVVENQRFARLDRVRILLDQTRSFMPRQDFEQAFPDQLFGRHPVVPAGSFVRELVHEIHDPAVPVADGAQDHERVQQRLGRRAEATLGFDKVGCDAPPLGRLFESRESERDVAGELFEKLDFARVEPVGPVGIDGQNAVQGATFVEREPHGRPISTLKRLFAPRSHSRIRGYVVAADRSLQPDGLPRGPFRSDTLDSDVHEVEVAVVPAE